MCDCSGWTKLGLKSTISLCFCQVCARMFVCVRVCHQGQSRALHKHCPCVALALPAWPRRPTNTYWAVKNTGWRGGASSSHSASHILLCGMCSLRRLSHTFSSFHTRTPGSSAYENKLLCKRYFKYNTGNPAFIWDMQTTYRNIAGANHTFVEKLKIYANSEHDHIRLFKASSDTNAKEGLEGK